MRFGNLEEAVGAYQQGAQWAQQQQQQRQQQAALLALGKMLSQPNGQPQGQPADSGMTPAQSAQAVQTAQGAAQTAGWPQAGPGGAAPPTSPASPVANPTAVLNDPTTLARLSAMAGTQGGAPQGPQMPVPGAPSMAQPRPAQQPPMPGLSSTAQPDAAGMDDPIKAAQQSIMSIAQGIKAANPNIDPRTLALAVDQQIETIKGVSPLTKAAMTAQMSVLNYQLKQQTLQQRMASEDQKWQIARQNANTREERNQIDAAHFTRMDALAQGRIDASIENNERTNATRVTTTEMNNQTSRDNNRDTNARQDRETTGRQGASDAAVYRSVYGNYLRQHPKDVVGATAAARAAVSDVQRGTPRSDIPSGDPLGGGGAPAPRGGGGAPAPRGGGGGPKPSAQDMAYLKQHKSDPAVVAAFKKHFGAAAAQAAMR